MADGESGGPSVSLEDLMVVEEVWENQRYRPLTGWTRSTVFDGGFQGFSDRLGSTVYSKEGFPALKPPQGWEWADDDWNLDLAWADVDEEGWCYAPSFNTLREQLLVNAVSAAKTATDFVRRRRWTRPRVCMAAEARTEWDGYVEHLRGLEAAEQQRLRRREQCYEALKTFEAQRTAAAVAAFRRADHELLAQGCRLAETFDALVALKVLLKRRAGLDRRYTSAMYSFLGTFTPKLRRPLLTDEAGSGTIAGSDNDGAAAAAAAEKGDAEEAKGSEAKGGESAAPAAPIGAKGGALYTLSEEVDDHALELQKGFSMEDDGGTGLGSVATFRSVWERMGGDAVLQPQWAGLRCLQNFASETEGLVVRAEHLINELADAMQTCADLRRHLKKRLAEREEDCAAAWKNYGAVYDTVSLEAAMCIQKLRLVAADPLQHLTGKTGVLEEATGAGGRGADKSDLWVAENAYRSAAHQSTNACLALAKCIPKVLIRVAELEGAAGFLFSNGGHQFLKRQRRMLEAALRGFSGEAAEDPAETYASATDDVSDEAKAGEAAQARLQQLMKEAQDSAAGYTAEAIEAKLPPLHPSKLVVRTALAQRVTLDTAAAARRRADDTAEEGAASGDSDLTSKQPVLVVLSLDGFLHIFDTENSTFDPERIAGRGPQLSLDVRPQVKGMEVVDSNLAPNAMRIRGALKGSVMRMSMGGLFDVVLAEWSPNLHPGAATGASGTPEHETWKQLILSPLMEYGVAEAEPPRPRGSTLDVQPKLDLNAGVGVGAVVDTAADAAGDAAVAAIGAAADDDYTEIRITFEHEGAAEEPAPPAPQQAVEALAAEAAAAAGDGGDDDENVAPPAVSPEPEKRPRTLVTADSGGPSDLDMLLDPFSPEPGAAADAAPAAAAAAAAAGAAAGGDAEGGEEVTLAFTNEEADLLAALDEAGKGLDEIAGLVPDEVDM